MKIVCLGDSLTSGLGVPIEHIWTEIISQKTGYSVINKGINGDTSGGMLARFQRDVIDEKPDVVFLMGGGNDFIMGCDPAVVKANTMAMAHQARAANIKVIVGAATPPLPEEVRRDWQQFSNFGVVDQRIESMSRWLEKFCRTFEIPYVNLYQQFGEVIYDKAGEYYLDGIHPNRKGHQIIAEIVLQCGIL